MLEDDSPNTIIYMPDHPLPVKPLIDKLISLSINYNNVTYRISYDGATGNYLIRFFSNGKEIT